MKRARLNPRKLLIASAGVATVNYAFAAGCGGGKGERESVIANLMPGPPYVSFGDAGPSNATVANLVASPPPISGPGARDQGPVAAPPPVPAPVPNPAALDVSDGAKPGDAADDGN